LSGPVQLDSLIVQRLGLRGKVKVFRGFDP